MAKWDTYNGWAYTYPSTGVRKRIPKLALETEAGVSIDSVRFCPVRNESLCWVRTLVWAKHWRQPSSPTRASKGGKTECAIIPFMHLPIGSVKKAKSL